MMPWGYENNEGKATGKMLSQANATAIVAMKNNFERMRDEIRELRKQAGHPSDRGWMQSIARVIADEAALSNVDIQTARDAVLNTGNLHAENEELKEMIAGDMIERANLRLYREKLCAVLRGALDIIQGEWAGCERANPASGLIDRAAALGVSLESGGC